MQVLLFAVAVVWVLTLRHIASARASRAHSELRKMPSIGFRPTLPHPDDRLSFPRKRESRFYHLQTFSLARSSPAGPIIDWKWLELSGKEFARPASCVISLMRAQKAAAGGRHYEFVSA